MRPSEGGQNRKKGRTNPPFLSSRDSEGLFQSRLMYQFAWIGKRHDASFEAYWLLLTQGGAFPSPGVFEFTSHATSQISVNEPFPHPERFYGNKRWPLQTL